MKSLLRASILMGLVMVLIACQPAAQVTPSPVPSPSATYTYIPTFAPAPTDVWPAALPTVSFSNSTPPSPPPVLPASSENALRPTRAYPTPFPTIDPTTLPGMLRASLSVLILQGTNGRALWKVTGWDYGFRQRPCDGYQWLDADHLLVYPRTGQQTFDSGRRDLGSEPVVITLSNGNLWLRPITSTPAPEWDCDTVYFSRELGLIINQERGSSASSSTKEIVMLYTFDGRNIGTKNGDFWYWGKILGISPSGTKLLVDDDTIIDLRTGKITDLAWYMDYDLELSSRLYWSSDETRVYRCCFYYADLKTGQSYSFTWNDLRAAGGEPTRFPIHPHPDGQWVRNETYFFPKWDYWTYAHDPAVIFSPAEKKYYVISAPGLLAVNPETLTYRISPDGMYVWVTGFSEVDGNHSFLVDLTTLATVPYDLGITDFEWSPDSKFGLMQTNSDQMGISHTELLSVSNKKIEPVDWDFDTSWRPADHVLADLWEKGQVLAVFNAQSMSTKEWKLPTTFTKLAWDLKGERIALVAEDGSLWQVGYPGLQDFEQLTGPLPDPRKVSWSPDGQYILVDAGPDIYVVDTVK